MIKVLLVSLIENPLYSNSGIEYIAYALRKSKINVVIKYFHNDESEQQITESISLDYDFYGFSIYSTNYQRLKKVAKYIKNKDQSKIVFFGGGFVSLNYLDISSEMDGIDYLVLGDGEEPIKRIINHNQYFESKLTGDCNIVSQQDSKGKKPCRNLDVNRWCSFDYFEQFTKDENKNKVHCLLTKTNVCTGACTFCCSRKGKIIYKEIDRLIEEIKYVATNFSVTNFYFSDDNIFDLYCESNLLRLKMFFEKIKELNMNLVFSGFAKATSIKKENIDLYKLMSDIGFYFLFIGVDAGNENDRILYNKKPTIEENIEALQLLEECGIWARYGLIGFNPYSTLDTLRENYLFLTQIKSTNYYHYGGLSLQLFKHTKLYQKVKNENLLKQEYSFENVYSYNFIDNDVEKIMSYMRNTFLPSIGSVEIHFTKLKRYYEMVKHINEEALRYEFDIKRFEEEEFDIVSNYFKYLYLDNDITYCRRHMSELVNKMKNKAVKYKKICSELEEIYYNTSIYKRI